MSEKQWYYRLSNRDNEYLPVEERVSGFSWVPIREFPHISVEVTVSDGDEALGTGIVKFESGVPTLKGWASHLQWESPELSFH